MTRTSMNRLIGYLAILLAIAAFLPSCGPAGAQRANDLTAPPSGTSDGTLLALDASTGKQLWSASLPMGAVNPPVASNGIVLVAGGYDCRNRAGTLAAFDAVTGALTWTRPTLLGPFCFDDLAAAGGTAVAAASSGAGTSGNNGNPQATVEAIDLKGGTVLWTSPGEEPVLANDLVLVQVAGQPGTPSSFDVWALDRQTGHRRWTARPLTTNMPPATRGSQGFFVGVVPPTLGQYGPNNMPPPPTRRITALDLANGRVKWQADLPGESDSGYPLSAGDVVVLSSAGQYLVTPSITSAAQKTQPQQGWTTSVVSWDPATGRELWRKASSGTGDVIPPAPFVLAATGTVYLEQAVQASPSGKQAATPSTCTSRIEALEPTTGAVRWRADLAQGCMQARGTLAASPAMAVLTLVGVQNRVVALDAASGKEVWSRPIPSTGGPFGVQLAIAGGVVYVSVAGRFIAAQGD